MLVPILKSGDFRIRKLVLHGLDLIRELICQYLICLIFDLRALFIEQIIGRSINHNSFYSIFEEDII